MISPFLIKQQDQIPSPTLIFRKDRIEFNIKKSIEIAGSPDRLRPHVKTHKTKEIIRMQKALGISRFKCATIAEAEMIAQSEGIDVLIAYPLVGPNIGRFIKLGKTYPLTSFSAVVESVEGANELAEAATKNNCKAKVFLELDPGLHRTGITPGKDAIELYRLLCSIPVFEILGIHCYDGHIHQSDIDERKVAAQACYTLVSELKSKLKMEKLPVPQIVIGGTPAFGIYSTYPDLQLSPGTCFLQDWGYARAYKDLEFDFAAVILARVISVHPEESIFTIDVGSKAIASDPVGKRGFIVDLPGAEPCFQNEEHWVFKIDSKKLPNIGTVLQVIPTHICPTSALYEEAYVIDSTGQWLENWKIVARNRKITI